MKDAYYFSHDANARNDEKLLFIRSRVGLEAYGLYWVLIEMMHESATGKLSLKLKDGIAWQNGFTIERFNEILNDCFFCGLFLHDEEHFWSERVIRNKEQLISKQNHKSLIRSESGKKGAEARWQKMAKDGKGIANEWQNMAKVKESKVNESIEVNTVSKKQVFTKPTQIEISEYLVTEKNFDDFYAQGFASKFFHYYESNGWKVGKNPMKSWKSAVSLWISKESENKPKNGLRNDSEKSLIEKHMEVNKILKQKYANESANNL